VRPLEAGLYELVDGERRYRSAMNVGLSEVPVFIRELDDKEALEYSLTKFLLSEDLNPVEETQGILNLLSLELDYTQEEIISLLYRMDNEAKGKVTHNVVGSEAKSIIASLFSAIGMSWESFVNHRLPLLRLPESVLGALSEGKLAYTKAQAIARIKDEVQRDRLLNDAILQDLSLSQIQQRIKTIKSLSSEPQPLTTIQSRLDNVYRQVKKAKLWEHPRKKQPLETLLTQMEELLSNE
jgi:ParB family chromosome partitioning protein